MRNDAGGRPSVDGPQQRGDARKVGENGWAARILLRMRI
jgi:hypothetical protein